MLCDNFAKYIDLCENTLEFEIKVFAYCVDCGTIPPQSIIIFAILNNPDLITINPTYAINDVTSPQVNGGAEKKCSVPLIAGTVDVGRKY